MRINLALEWFLNPDHLPFIIGKERGLFAEKGIDLNIIQPDEHYDGFEALKKGEIEMATNEPLHLIEQFDENMLSLGSFFTTRGGVILTPEGFQKLKKGEKIRISSPVSNEITNRIGFELIKRYCDKFDIAVEPDSVEFTATDFYHIANIKKGFDGAWLFFYNFEGVEAKHENVELIFIDSTTADFPNFSALDIFIQKSFYRENLEKIEGFISVVKESIQFISENPKETIEAYYSFSGEEKSELFDDIILETSKCFNADFSSNYSEQTEVLEFFREIGVTDLEVSDFKKAFLK